MNIDLKELNYKDCIIIDTEVSFPNEYYENSKVRDLNNVKVDGRIAYDDTDEYYAMLNVSGEMILEDSVTLEDVSFPFDFEIDDNIPSNCINKQNILDLLELLWENIVLEVPIAYSKSDAKNLKGDHWEVVDSENVKEEINPELAKIKDYYEGGE